MKKKIPKEKPKQVDQTPTMTDNLFFFRPNEHIKTQVPKEKNDDRSNPGNSR